MHQERQQSLSFFDIDPNAYGITTVKMLMRRQIFPVVALGGRSKRLMKPEKDGIHLVGADQVVFAINE